MPKNKIPDKRTRRNLKRKNNFRVTTETCGFCYVSTGIVTGCDPNREDDEEGHCSLCRCLLPPKGKILQQKRLEILDSEENKVAVGHVIKVERKSDGEEDWYLFHCTGGRKSKLFGALGLNSTRIKEFLAEQNLVAFWPSGPKYDFCPFAT